MAPARRWWLCGLIIDIFVIVAVLVLLLFGPRAHAEATVSQDQYNRDWTAFNGHLTYDDGRINDMESQLQFLRGICYAVGTLSLGSVALRFKEKKP